MTLLCRQSKSTVASKCSLKWFSLPAKFMCQWIWPSYAFDINFQPLLKIEFAGQTVRQSVCRKVSLSVCQSVSLLVCPSVCWATASILLPRLSILALQFRCKLRVKLKAFCVLACLPLQLPPTHPLTPPPATTPSLDSCRIAARQQTNWQMTWQLISFAFTFGRGQPDS